MVRLDGRQLRPQQDDARGPRQTLQGSSICDSLEKMLSSSQVVEKNGSWRPGPCCRQRHVKLHESGEDGWKQMDEP